MSQIESGEIPRKYKISNTYDALRRWIDTKLRFEVFENIVTGEPDELALRNWEPGKLLELAKIDRVKERMIENGLL